MRILLFATALVVGLGLTVADAFHQKHHDEKMVQGGYNYGKYVGHILGSCDTLADVAKYNPDSVWAHDPKIVAALQACDEARKKHGPGSEEIVQVAE